MANQAHERAEQLTNGQADRCGVDARIDLRMIGSKQRMDKQKGRRWAARPVRGQEGRREQRAGDNVEMTAMADD